LARGSATVELTDLTGPTTALYDATGALGAKPWSRIVSKFVGHT
jgi:hypothetical protein